MSVCHIIKNNHDLALNQADNFSQGGTRAICMLAASLQQPVNVCAQQEHPTMYLGQEV
jgi:hypothetical protein